MERSLGAAELVAAVAEHWRGGDPETRASGSLGVWALGAWTLGGSHEGAVEKRGGCDLRRVGGLGRVHRL